MAHNTSSLHRHRVYHAQQEALKGLALLAAAPSEEPMKLFNYLRVLLRAAIDWTDTEDSTSQRPLLLPRNEALKLVRRRQNRKLGRLL